MRLALLSIGLASVVTAGFLQDEPKRPLGFPGYRQEERARMEEELQGAWSLLEYKSPVEVHSRRDYNGFASFQDGYFTFLFRLNVTERGILGDRPRAIVQAGVHRYRITDGLRLQTAAWMAFTNDNSDYELEPEPPSYPREYRIKLEEGLLSLRRWDDLEFVFRRTDGSGSFPQQAADSLERSRGRNFEPQRR